MLLAYWCFLCYAMLGQLIKGCYIHVNMYMYVHVCKSQLVQQEIFRERQKQKCIESLGILCGQHYILRKTWHPSGQILRNHLYIIVKTYYWQIIHHNRLFTNKSSLFLYIHVYIQLLQLRSISLQETDVSCFAKNNKRKQNTYFRRFP